MKYIALSIILILSGCTAANTCNIVGEAITPDKPCKNDAKILCEDEKYVVYDCTEQPTVNTVAL